MALQEGLVCRFLRASGLPAGEAAELLAAAGISATLRAGLPIEDHHFAQLYRLVAERLDDELPGMLSRPQRAGTFKYACLGMVQAATLEGAMRRYASFLRLVVDDFRLEARTASSWCLCLSEPPGSRTRHPMAYEMMVRVLHGVACWLVARPLRAEAVRLAAPQPPADAAFVPAFAETVEYGASRTELVLPRSAMRLPVLRGRNDTRAFLARAPHCWLFPHAEPAGTLERVREYILRHRAWDAAQADLADALAMTARTLSRRLREEGSSLKQLREQLRREHAMARLASSQAPLMEIALDLGYHDASSFHRAFRAWTGMAPGRYRRAAAGSLA